MPPYNPGKGFTKGSPFNPKRLHPIHKVVKPHNGDDWPAVTGTAIPAAADGEVTYSGWKSGYGNVVYLKHQIRGQTVETRYAHMDKPSKLVVGEKVTAGQTVGPVGNTGGSTGPHLHFEVRVDGNAVNPASFDFPEGGERGPWAFPFNDLATKKEILDSIPFFGSPTEPGALSKTHDGFYPIGLNGLWHGGIHFDSGSGIRLDQRGGVRCINDGEVVAYRVDKKYPEIEFKTSGKRAAYSTGFTLVRHRLELPAPPAQSKTSTPAPQASAGKALVFYSLYMHQLDWQGYEESPSRERPTYWGEPTVFRVGERAKDQQEAQPQPSAVSPSSSAPPAGGLTEIDASTNTRAGGLL